jgi:hypothetical protein
MASVAHYVMMHYAEKESIKKKWKKKYRLVWATAKTIATSYIFYFENK